MTIKPALASRAVSTSLTSGRPRVEDVSRIGTVRDVERAQRLALRQTPLDERDARQVRWSQGAAIAVAASGLLLSGLLIVFYVVPFQEASGALLGRVPSPLVTVCVTASSLIQVTVARISRSQ